MLTDPQKALMTKMLMREQFAQTHRITKFGATRLANVTAPGALAGVPVGSSLLANMEAIWKELGLGVQQPPVPTFLESSAGYPVDLDPVYGWSQLVLYQDGAYNFSGDFHNDSDLAPYTYSFAWGVIGASQILYLFSHKGSLAPTYGGGGGGSSDDPWDQSGSNPALKDGWSGLADNVSFHWQASSSLDITTLLNELVTAVKAVQTIVQVVEIVAAA